MYQILLFVHVLIALGIIVLVLLQQGKGADAGAAFGGGSSSTVFGSQGASSFLTRLTGGLATAFFVNCLILAMLAGSVTEPSSVVDLPGTQAPVELPAQPALPEVPSSPQPTDSFSDDVPSLPSQ